MADQDIEVKRSQTQTQQQGAGVAPPPVRTPSRAPLRLDPFQAMRQEIDRMFDHLWQGFGMPALRRPFDMAAPWRGEPGLGAATPAVDIAEDERAYYITAELPGLSDKDIEVNLTGAMLTISGEKREEREETERNYHFSERRYGSFRRTFEVPEAVDRDRIEASFKNGLLELTLPKSQEAQQRQKRIEVKAQ